MGPRFESVKVHQWPVGQVVKTEASHAFNIGSNPVRVTKELRNKQLEPNEGFDIKDGSTPSIRVGIDCDEGPPVPIPNTEVKLICADNTCRVTCREDR